VDFYERQSINRRRTALLIASFVGFFAVFGIALDVVYAGYLTGGEGFPIITSIALGVATAIALLGYYKGDSLVLLSLVAQPLRPSNAEHRELSNIVNEIALAAGLPRPRVFVIPDPSPNAMATGRDPEHSAIAVTDGALALLDREETQGVVAHEMAHIANRDTMVMTLVAVLLGGVVMLADWARRTLYFSRPRRGAQILLVLPVLVLAALSPLLSQLLAMAVSRQREYLADATGVEFTRNPAGLAQALEKIQRFTSPLRGATRGTAHLFIVNPLRRRRDERDGRWADLFSSHPPIAQRIALLRALPGQQS
jgi:heat shock protein HtpX